MPSTIREELLHYVWKLKSFEQNDLTTTDGQSIEVIHPGHHNHHSGPDFQNGKVRISDTLWIGHIEIHIKSSDWHKHGHHNDDHYENVILHVVMKDDAPIKRKDQTKIPTLEIGPHLPSKTLARYHELYHHQLWVPCENHLGKISEITKESCKDQALTQRLAKKAKELEKELNVLDGDLTTLIFQRLAWTFGLKVNAVSMKRLSELLAYKSLQKHLDQPYQVEAMLFGVSGLLPQESDSTYVNILKREFKVLQQKFNLTCMSSVEWKYGRLRPPNFPEIRIAQFAALLKKNQKIEDLIFSSTIDQIKDAFEIDLHDFWRTHYRFEKPSEDRIKHIGSGTRRLIMINAVVPLLFMYGSIRESQGHKDRAITFLENLPAEDNSITKRWKELGMHVSTAQDTQALIELKNHYCDKHACLKCPIGHKIMSS